MCRLQKALYGHPESGAHWEEHLTKAVREIGGQPVEGHPSMFYLPEERQLMVVYVDDLIVSGPAVTQMKVWERLKAKVKTGEPEVLDRFLGRTHAFSSL